MTEHDERGRLIVAVPAYWSGTDKQGDRLRMTTEERLRAALVRLAGCRCRPPLLGYTGGQLIDGPRCRVCGCGVVFKHEESEDGS